jgi:hypothetical protein
MVCPKCKIMTQRVRRGKVLEHVCRYRDCRSFGAVVARVPIPEPVIEEEADSVTESAETTDE